MFTGFMPPTKEANIRFLFIFIDFSDICMAVIITDIICLVHKYYKPDDGIICNDKHRSVSAFYQILHCQFCIIVSADRRIIF